MRKQLRSPYFWYLALYYALMAAMVLVAVTQASQTSEGFSWL